MLGKMPEKMKKHTLKPKVVKGYRRFRPFKNREDKNGIIMDVFFKKYITFSFPLTLMEGVYSRHIKRWRGGRGGIKTAVDCALQIMRDGGCIHIFD